MEENQKTLETFYNYLSKNYKDLTKMYRQFCYINHIDFSEDILNDTVVKVADIIQRKGLKKTSESDIADYFFKAFKFNTYQQHLQEQKELIDFNIDVNDVKKIDKEYDEDELEYSQLVTIRCRKLIEENFDDIDQSIFRLKYLMKVDGKFLTFKDIKQLTKIPDVRKRLVNMNRFLREHSEELLKK